MNIMDDSLSNFIGHESPKESPLDHDVLDEFLDQRVYESLTHNQASSYYSPLDIPSPLIPQESFTDNHVASTDLQLSNHDVPFTDNQATSIAAPTDTRAVDDISSHVPPHCQSQSQITPDYMFFDHLDSYTLTPSQILDKSLPHPDYEVQLSNYDYARESIARVSFGNPSMKTCPDSVHVPHPSYLDFSPETMRALPYKLSVGNLPNFSRVETQIKLRLSVGPLADHVLLHIPQDLVSKNKFCLTQPVTTLLPRLVKQIMFLDAYVLTSDLKSSCNICQRCIKREHKRASRRKEHGEEADQVCSKDTKSQEMWGDESIQKKALIFNCKELLSFPPPSGLVSHKSMELLARIICYCRHHQEQQGFKLLFVVKDHAGNVLAKDLSAPIMIMDRKKCAAGPDSKPRRHQLKTEDLTDTFDVTENLTFSHPLSPHSLDELLLADSETRGLKRKKLLGDLAYSSNPMLRTFSPISNSDTNASIHLVQTGGSSKDLVQSFDNALSESNLPTISRIIPAQGPIRGGIEVTLLGFNFRPGLRVKFGAQQALATHCWSESTIVTYLPPALEPGQVLVLFEDECVSSPRHQQIFTYTDDTDRQLIELALQIVGLKMNGKLEDAKNIAKRIVGNDGGASLPAAIKNVAAISNSEVSNAPNDWFDDAQRAVKQLALADMSSQDVLINFLSLVELPNCPILIPNWQLCNKQGQTLLHLGTLCGYDKLVNFLILHGCKLDVQDNQGLTPLFLAGMAGHRHLINVFLERKLNWNLKLSNEKYLVDYCDPNVLDLFSIRCTGTGICAGDTLVNEKLGRSLSLDSLDSMFQGSSSRHHAHMSHESSNMLAPESDLELADLEFESDEDLLRSESCRPQQESTQAPPQQSAETLPLARVHLPPNLWQKVKNAFNKEDDLPKYDDLFPLGPNDSTAKPKNLHEEQFNLVQAHSAESGNDSDVDQDDSDSLEDIVTTFLNHPRKRVENDKMLLFFWFPALVCILGYMFMVLVMGYQFAFYEAIQVYVRETLAQIMVGGERVKRMIGGGGGITL